MSAKKPGYTVDSSNSPCLGAALQLLDVAGGGGLWCYSACQHKFPKFISLITFEIFNLLKKGSHF